MYNESDITFGEEIRLVRMNSRYRESLTFAQQVGMSYEGLRKIETCERLPNRDTLEKILDTGSVPDKKADELRQWRDLSHAEREGLSLPHHASNEKIEKLSERLVSVFEAFLAECDTGIPDDERKALYRRVISAVREEIRG